MTPPPAHRPINRRYDPGRYRLAFGFTTFDRNHTPDRAPSGSVDGTPANRSHDSHRTKRGTP